jgi:polyisoprenoid-binding protein YceI
MRIMTTLCTVGLLTAVTLTGCESSPSEGKHKAAASEPVAQPATPAAPSGSAVAKYAVDSSNSSLDFVGAKITDTHDGKFGAFSGSVDLVDGDPAKSSLSVEIQMGSLEIQPAKLAGHLKTADFFDVANFPTAKFSTTSVVQAGAPDEYKVTGNLTLRGVTKSIDFPAKIALSGDKLTVAAEFAINRKDFGIVYPGMVDDLIKDDVLIKLALNPTKG